AFAHAGESLGLTAWAKSLVRDVDVATARQAIPGRSRGLALPTLRALLLFAFLPSQLALAQHSVEGFYRSRQVNLIVGYGPGGGYDIVARLVARHLARYIPGNPSIVVQNMPGAGSMRAVNYLYSIAPKDGTTFALV